MTSPRWRTGRKNPHTIYDQQGPEPSNEDPFVGSLNTPEHTALAVAGMEALATIRNWHELFVEDLEAALDCTQEE